MRGGDAANPADQEMHAANKIRKVVRLRPDTSIKETSQAHKKLLNLRSTVFWSPRPLLFFSQLAVGTGLGFVENSARLKTECCMVHSMGNICSEIAGFMGQQKRPGDLAGVGKDHNAQPAVQQNECFIFFGVKVAVRSDVRAGLHGIQKTLTAGFIGRMEIVILAQPGVPSGIGG